MIRWWREIERWIEDEEGNHQSAFPEYSLSDFIMRNVAPVDRTTVPLDELNIIAKITFGGDLHIRTDEEKRGYKGPLFYAHSGDLVISKIRVAQGSLCIVPDELGHLAVSAEYPVYSINHERVSGDFIRLVIRSTAFKQRLSRLRSGNTTKARIRPAQFEALKIPLPSLDAQRALVTTYIDALARAAKLHQEAQTIEQAGLRAFEEALGVAPPPPLPELPVFIARFKDVERWSHEGILRAIAQPQTASAMWPMIPLGSVGKVTYGIQKCPANRPSTHARPYLRVANVQRGILDLREIKYINVPDEEMPKFRLEEGDILLCEGNSADLVGRGAIWRGEIEDCVHQNHVLRVRLDQKKLLPEFVMAVINSEYGQAYFRSKAKRTTNLASINSREVASLPVPLLPTNHQQDLLQALQQSASAAETKRAQAQTLRATAWANFESALFTANPQWRE
ncbi:hypothetical protein [Methylocaldum sp.]|uniref:restriction endonuclease subunit S n=1 Tax=unclassified Methylocaldum TaxID=2622260 RepID=UPI00322028FD